MANLVLTGWSFGGVVAYEVALQLMKKGVQVKGVLLIDSPSPINHTPLSDSLIDSVVNLDARSANSELGRLVRTQFAMNTRMLGRYDPHATGGLCPPLALLRSTEGYTPPALADVPIWLADRSDPKLAAAGWDTLTSVKILDIPGHHFQPFHPSNVSIPFIMSLTSIMTVVNRLAKFLAALLRRPRIWKAYDRRSIVYCVPSWYSSLLFDGLPVEIQDSHIRILLCNILAESNSNICNI